MTEELDWEATHVLEALRWNRLQLEDHEREWKKLREHSRWLCLQLITEHGYSMSKVAQLSGHHRNTMKIWLDIHNAEVKAAKRARAGQE